MTRKRLHITVNGKRWEGIVQPNALLVDVLREQIGLTGTKIGCDDGSCGACTIRMDGMPMQACMLLATTCEGHRIQTIEGLAEGPAMDIVQRAFNESGASQCGYCTPGFVVTVRSLIDSIGQGNKVDIRRAMGGNFCRCTGYTKIFDAVEKAIRWQERIGQEREEEKRSEGVR